MLSLFLKSYLHTYIMFLHSEISLCHLKFSGAVTLLPICLHALLFVCFSRLVVAEMFVWAFSRDPSVSVETTRARLRNRPGVAVHETAGNGGVGVQDVSIICLKYLASHDITMVWFTQICCFSAVLACSNPPAHTSCQGTGSKRKGTAGVAVELKANYKLPCLSRKTKRLAKLLHECYVRKTLYCTDSCFSSQVWQPWVYPFLAEVVT